MAMHDVTVELFYSGAWNDHTEGELYTGEADNGDDVKITYGRGAESGGITPASATLTFRSWRFNPDNVSGDLYGLIGRNTPLRITVDGDVRFTGEVASWTPRQSLGGDVQVPDRWVEVEAAGVLRRIEAGTDPLPSSLRTLYLEASPSPIAYWPLDAGQLSRTSLPTFGPYSFDQSSNKISELAGGDIAPWLEQGVGMEKGLNVYGVTVMSASPTEWTVDAMFRCADDARDFSLEMIGNSQNSSGERLDFWLGFEIATELYQVALVRVTPTGQTGETLASGSFTMGDDQPHHIRFTAADNGTAVDWAAYIDGIELASGTKTSLDMQGRARIRLYSPSGTGNTPALFAHIAVFEGAPPALADTVDAAFGYAGEKAGDRFTRLSGDAGVTATVAGDADDTVPMGPQFRGILAAQYADIEATDDGIVADDVDGGVTYTTGRGRYNQTPTLTLDYDAFEVAPPLHPVLDDKRIRNDVTANRREGESARAVDQDSVDAIGRYADRADVNVFSDLVVDAAAGWWLHTGAESGTRFERLTVDLDASPHLLPAVVATKVGSRALVQHLPAELTPNDASLLVIGWSETIAPDRRKITFNCIPEAPFHVAELDHADYATVGPLFTTLSGNHSATTTGIVIQPHGDGAWDHETNFDVVIAGERMTVTSIGASSGTFPNQSQILSVVRSVNGVVKTHVNGEQVKLFYPAYIGM